MASYHVLIVDDQRDVRYILRTGLETLEHDIAVTDVPSGEEAILVILRQEIDLLVADIRLPGISGLELVASARSRNPDLKYILITGMTEPKIRRQVANSGADAFFFKPIELTDFLDATLQILGLFETPEPEPLTLEELEGGPTEKKQRLSERLSSLRQELAAAAALMLDDSGRLLAQAGEIPDQVNNEAMIPSLMAVFSATSKVSQLLGTSVPKDLVYFSGSVYDCFITYVGQSMALLLVVDRLEWDEERMAVALRAIRPGVKDLLSVLADMGVPVEDEIEGEPAPPEPEPEEDIDITEVLPEVDAIFEQIRPSENVDDFWDTVTSDDSTKEVIRADAISYEQARQLGLTPKEEEE